MHMNYEFFRCTDATVDMTLHSRCASDQKSVVAMEFSLEKLEIDAKCIRNFCIHLAHMAFQFLSVKIGIQSEFFLRRKRIQPDGYTISIPANCATF